MEILSFGSGYSGSWQGRKICLIHVHEPPLIVPIGNDLNFGSFGLHCSSTEQVLHVEVKSKDGKFVATSSFIYALNTRPQRCGLWEELMRFKETCTMPCLVLGDFNAFVKDEEKVGYAGINVEPCDEMLHCLISCGIEDLPAVGRLHTWYNNQSSSSWMKIKLDRVLANEAWQEKYVSNALFLEVGIFDHSPMFLQPKESKKKPYQFWR